MKVKLKYFSTPETNVILYVNYISIKEIIKINSDCLGGGGTAWSGEGRALGSWK